MSKSISLAANVVCNLLRGSCRVGTAPLHWAGGHIPPAPVEDAPVGVKGGVETAGIKTDGEPNVRGHMDPISNEEAPAENDLGEGIAEPVEAYKGRSSSAL